MREDDNNSRVEVWVRGELGENLDPTLPEKIVTSTTRKTQKNVRTERQVEFAGTEAREEIILNDGESNEGLEELEALVGAFKPPPVAPPFASPAAVHTTGSGCRTIEPAVPPATPVRYSSRGRLIVRPARYR